jgi:hypothetical protein
MFSGPQLYSSNQSMKEIHQYNNLHDPFVQIIKLTNASIDSNMAVIALISLSAWWKKWT